MGVVLHSSQIELRNKYPISATWYNWVICRHSTSRLVVEFSWPSVRAHRRSSAVKLIVARCIIVAIFGRELESRSIDKHQITLVLRPYRTFPDDKKNTCSLFKLYSVQCGIDKWLFLLQILITLELDAWRMSEVSFPKVLWERDTGDAGAMESCYKLYTWINHTVLMLLFQIFWKVSQISDYLTGK